jgi:outer membrane protein assembly factor BamB
LYIADFSGLFHCVDAVGDGKGGTKVHWTYDMLAQSWGSPLIVEDKVYIIDEDGDVAIFSHREDSNEPLAEPNMGTTVYSTPVVADNTIFITTRDRLFAIGKP